jgi:hypothetical protein
MRTLFAVTASALSLTAFAVSFDPPDLALEQELHRQYLRQAGIEGDAGATPGKDSYIEYYRIQKGETLWSLSQTFYGDGHFWPRVWAQNRAIDNPHLIRPGHTLHFLLGSEDNTPSFRISEEEEQGVELANANANSNQNPLIEIPPPEIPPRPVLKIPQSFPTWQSVYKREPVRITDDKGLLKNLAPPVGKTYLQAYVQEEPLVPGGKFMEADLDSSLPTTNQYIYVRVNKGTALVGKKMLIVRDAGKLKKMNRNTDMPEAYLVQITGEIELSEPAESEEPDDEYDIYRALVTRATSLSLSGQALILGELQEISTSFEGTPGTTEAQIIGNGKHEAADLYAPGDTVFLNKGSNQGMAAGQILDIYVDRRTRKATDVKYSPAPSGTVRIVRVTPGLATAVVLSARDGLMPGDLVKQVSARRADREILEVQEGQYHKNADEGEVELELDEDGPEFGDEFDAPDGSDVETEF